MIDIALDQLSTLVALADEGTFEAAARRLHVTASAVSQRVRSAEVAAGQVLVQRTNPVRMTAAGDSLLRYARQVQLLQRDAERELEHNPDDALTIAIAVNADSLATWFLDALAPLAASENVVFDLHREDQERTLSLLRSGAVAAAVSSTPEAVQGCSSTPLGIMRYRAVCSAAFAARWLHDSPELPAPGLSALGAAPVVVFDRNDDLQHRFHLSVTGRTLAAPRHYIPTSADFAAAIRLGFGWGLLPEQQSLDGIRDGSLVELAAEFPVDVPLYWQRWNLRSAVLDAVTGAVVGAARTNLRRS
jgi:LysR family transcriptional regulator, chromosome initiation inhibitor